MICFSVRAMEVDGVYDVKIVARSKGRASRRKVLRGVKPEDMGKALKDAEDEMTRAFEEPQNTVL